MKTRIFIILSSFFICLNLYSQNKKDIEICSNISQSEIGIVKEYMLYDKDKPQILAKFTYTFDSEGKRTERILYVSDKKNNWIPAQMHRYKYNDNGTISNIIFTKWNKNRNCWNKESDYLVHIYDNTGKLLSINKRNQKTESNMAQK